MIYPVRRSWSAPGMYRLGGEEMQGMDGTGRSGLPTTCATLAEHMWRLPCGSVAKRPGFYPKERRPYGGKVRWSVHFGSYEYLLLQDGTLCRYNGRIASKRTVGEARWQRFGDRLMILAKGQWLVIDGADRCTLITSQGELDITSDFAASGGSFTLSGGKVHIPLIRAGTSPQGKGQGILPPNMLTPLVQESFVYTKADQTAQRNRFCLALEPQVLGDLPTNDDGTHADLPAADAAIRRQTLNASALLEVRLEETDAYGNTVSYWRERAFSHKDNINAYDAAVWISGIHNAALSFDGDDNIRITYYRPADQAAWETEQLLSCDAFTLFGVGGLPDRLFGASGSRMYYSGMDEPLYFGTKQYLDLGDSEVNIALLATDGTLLYALSDNGAWQIRGSALESGGEYALDAAFGISARLPCPRPMGEDWVIAGGELLFYSDQGVCAVTPSGILDERKVQVRSHRIRRQLEKEQGPIRLFAKGDYLYLVGGADVYLLDLQRKVKVSENIHSTHGYEAYCWPGLSIDCFTEGEALSFYKDGHLYEMFAGDDLTHYHDEWYVDDETQKCAIHARWRTPLLAENTDTHCFVGLSIYGGIRSAVRISFQQRGKWQILRDYDGRLGAFVYRDWRYGQFAYGDTEGRARYVLSLHGRHGLRLQFENDVMDQPFQLQTFILEYK